MAGEHSLGPSDAPCSGKTSTVHDGYLFWVMLLQTGKIVAHDSSASAPDQAHRLFTINPFTSEISFSPQISPTSPASRRASILTWSAIAKLGFCLAGLDSNVGPLLLQKPKFTTSSSLQNEFKPRSVTSSILSTYSKCLVRLLNLNGRRLHLREDSSWLLWFYIHILRILVLDLYVEKTYESKDLVMFQPSRTMFNCSRKSFGLLFRTPLLPITEKNRTRSSSASQCFKPVIREAKDPFSTSQDLLIVTISKIPEPFVEVSSTHHVLACGMLLVSLCFRVYMNLSLKFIVYPIFLMYVGRICSKSLYMLLPLWVE